jgi:hypothetical protein
MPKAPDRNEGSGTRERVASARREMRAAQLDPVRRPSAPAKRPAPRAGLEALRVLPWLALAAAVAVAVSGFGTRFDLWSYVTGLAILQYATYAALAVAALALIALLVARARAGRARPLAAALGIGLAAAALPMYLVWQARALPPINDISTDLANPPRFETILPLRARAPVPARYPGPDTARQQRASYPEVRTRVVHQPTDRVFAEALALARDSGWTIVASDPEKGRIEATATTFWFGFTDDVVIRVARLGNASRVDMRSVSRVGKGDLGANARRIRDFMARLPS